MTCNDIFKIVLSEIGLLSHRLSILDGKKSIIYSNARSLTFYLCQLYTSYSLDKIGEPFNMKKSTVLRGIRSIKNTIEMDKIYEIYFDRINKKIKFKYG